MKETSMLFLRALRAALVGGKADIEDLSPEEWRELLRMAQDHKVLPMILDAVHSCPGFGSLDAAELALLRRQARRQVMLQTLRTEEFLSLNRALRAAGIKPLVVKGLICRRLYHQPDQRPSGDEDVLIPEEQFDLCRQVMTDQGMAPVGEEKPGDYEVPFRKEGSPLYIELHKHLFPPESAAYGDMNRFFEGIVDRAVEVEHRGEGIWTMAPTDYLFYLICHAFKHFLHSGFGIRQVCDIVLFADRYGPDIQWEQVMANCGEIRGTLFAAAVFRIGEKHLGVECPGAFRALEVDEEPLLSDLLDGGLYGDANLSRKHSSNITLETVAAQKQGKRPRGTMRTSVFPSAQKLSGRYPYLREHPWLLPLAWSQRLWTYARETRGREDSSAAEALRIGADRVALLRQYGILR